VNAYPLYNLQHTNTTPRANYSCSQHPPLCEVERNDSGGSECQRSAADSGADSLSKENLPIFVAKASRQHAYENQSRTDGQDRTKMSCIEKPCRKDSNKEREEEL